MQLFKKAYAPRATGAILSAWFGGADSAWAGLSHVMGLALFLGILTRRFRFVFVTPLVGAALLWLGAQVCSSSRDSGAAVTYDTFRK